MERRRTFSEKSRDRALAYTALPFAGCAAALFAFHEIGRIYFGAWLLDLGSMSVPNARHAQLLFWWTLLGTAAAGLACLGVTRLLALFPHAGGTTDTTDRTWVIVVSTAVFALAVGFRAVVLRGAPLTDDESAYRFTAELLAGGRLWIESHPMKTFFDRVFMINDGRFYGQYFIGWSALLVPGVYLHVTGYMNAFYAALTVPALFGVVRRLAGPAAARVVTVLFLTSPMLIVGSATEMSHPSCLMALAWTFYFVLRAREMPAAWWNHAGVASCFGVAFLIRPTSALGAGLPLLVGWLRATAATTGAIRRRALVVFVVPALALAAVFFAVNAAQNGSPFVTSYVRMQAYMKEVNYQWVGWSTGAPPSISQYILPNRHVGKAVADTTIAFARLTFGLLAAPVLLAILAFAGRSTGARLAWWSIGCYTVLHAFTGDAGVDTFGPVHWYEMSLPVLVLCGIGYARLAEKLHGWSPAMPATWPGALVGAVVLVTLVGYTPVRLAAVSRIAAAVNIPFDAVAKARLSNAIVFTPNWVPLKCSAPTSHFVYFRPNNDPWLRNDVLWANHVGWEADHELMKFFPNRSGYLLQWKGCDVQFMRLLTGAGSR